MTWHMWCRYAKDLYQRLAPAHAAQHEFRATRLLHSDNRNRPSQKNIKKLWISFWPFVSKTCHTDATSIAPDLSHWDSPSHGTCDRPQHGVGLNTDPRLGTKANKKASHASFGSKQKGPGKKKEKSKIIRDHQRSSEIIKDPMFGDLPSILI